MEALRIFRADLSDPAHGEAVVEMVDLYAQDPNGRGRGLSPEAKAKLPDMLRNHPGAVVLLAFFGERPVGVAACVLSYSTFAASPVLNVHDLAVAPEARGQGVGGKLLEEAERVAREAGCRRMTLEVGEHNVGARRLYARMGFRGTGMAGEESLTRFCTKDLPTD